MQHAITWSALLLPVDKRKLPSNDHRHQSWKISDEYLNSAVKTLNNLFTETRTLSRQTKTNLTCPGWRNWIPPTDLFIINKLVYYKRHIQHVNIHSYIYINAYHYLHSEWQTNDTKNNTCHNTGTTLAQNSTTANTPYDPLLQSNPANCDDFFHLADYDVYIHFLSCHQFHDEFKYRTFMHSWRWLHA